MEGENPHHQRAQDIAPIVRGLYFQTAHDCHDRLCKASTFAQWTAISLGQDGAFASGMIAGVPVSMYEGVEALVKMGLSLIETFEAIKSLVMSGDLVGNVADSMKQSFIEP